MRFLNDILTGSDGVQHEAANHITVWGSLAGLIMTVHQYFVAHVPFDLQGFGVGLGAIVAAMGAAQRLRGDAQPPG